MKAHYLTLFPRKPPFYIYSCDPLDKKSPKEGANREYEKVQGVMDKPGTRIRKTKMNGQIEIDCMIA